MENWAFEKEWLDRWAVHYETGEKLPEELITKIKEAAVFNEGYACNRQLGFSLLDMAWHTITNPAELSVDEFERKTMSITELLEPAEGTNMSCSFTHLFGGDYAAGYYGYKWAEVLDADAFYYFRDSGLFNKEVAESFRRNILEKGGSDRPMTLYVRFRGQEPSIEPFLERSGLKN
jgi:peptidyl-dipeptidase Dcp